MATATRLAGEPVTRLRTLAALALVWSASVGGADDDRPPGLIAQDNVTPFTRVGEYGDWSVACDNRRYCAAVSVSREQEMRRRSSDPGDHLRPVLRVERASDAREPAHVIVDLRVDGQAPSLAGLTLNVLLDADRAMTGTGYALRAVAPGLYALAAADSRRFIDASLASNVAVVLRPGNVIHGHISTAGMSAALRHADHEQGRAGSTEAMIARGARIARRPTDTGGSAIVARRGTAVTLDAQSERMFLLFVCGVGATAADADVQVSDMPDHVRIIGIRCQTAQADAETIWLLQRCGGLPQLLALPRPDVQPGEYEQAILVDSHFDAASGILSTRFNNRPYGDAQRRKRDCGWIRRWQWTANGMAMIEARTMPACMGLLPDAWMLTYFALDRLR